ncbi:Uncharacterised protein [Mycobacteroides abscessus subsp. abscessus]|nr:Uncharacterised protein [Mycobacteroides abscessus subsp. abscessus]
MDLSSSLGAFRFSNVLFIANSIDKQIKKYFAAENLFDASMLFAAISRSDENTAIAYGLKSEMTGSGMTTISFEFSSGSMVSIIQNAMRRNVHK